MRIATGRADSDGNSIWQRETGAHAIPRVQRRDDTAPRQAKRNPGRPTVAEQSDFTRLTSDRPEWMFDAPCNHRTDIDWQPSTRTEAVPAKRVCWFECSVRERCLAYALASLDHTTRKRESGIWGGTLDYERTLMRNNPKHKPRPPGAPLSSGMRRSPEHYADMQRKAKIKANAAMKARQAKVARLIDAGRTHEAIATELKVTRRTIERDASMIRAARQVRAEQEEAS